MPKNEVKVILTGDSTNAVNAFKKLETETQSLTSKIKSHWLALSAAAIAAYAVINKAGEYITLGAKAQQAEESFHLVAASFHENANKIIADMKRVSAGTVDDSDIMQKAVKGMVQGLSGNQLVKIMEAARISARVTGEDVGTAYETITDSIANNLPRALIRYGLVTKDQMKIVNQALTAGIDDIRLYDLVMANAAKQSAAFGQVTESNAEKLQRINASFHDLKETIGKFLIEGIGKLAMGWEIIGATAGSAMLKAKAALSLNFGEFKNIDADYAKTIEDIKKKWGQGSETAKQLGGDVSAADKKIQDMMNNLKKQIAAKEAAKHFGEIQRAINEMTAAVKDYESGLISLNPTLDETEQKFMQWEDAFEKLAVKIEQSKIPEALKETLINEALQTWGKGFDLLGLQGGLKKKDEWYSFWSDVEVTAKKGLDQELAAIDKWVVDNAEKFQKNYDQVLMIVEEGERRKKETTLKYHNATQEAEIKHQLFLIDLAEQEFKISKTEATQQRLIDYQELIKVQEKFLSTLDKTKDASAWYAQQAAIDQTRQKIVELTQRQKELTGTFEQGMSEGIKGYFRELKTNFELGVDLAKTTAQSMQDSFSTLFFDAMKGKLKSWKDYFISILDSIMKKLSDMLAQWLLFGQGGGGGGGLWGLVGSLLPGGGRGGTMMVGGFMTSPLHQGGLIMHQGGLVPSYNLPRYHSGYLAPDERMAILQTGERVLSRNQNKEYEKNQSLTVNVPITVDSGNKRMISELRSEIEETAIRVIRRHS